MVEKLSLKVRGSAFVAMLWMTNYVSGVGLQNLWRLNFVHQALSPANSNLSLLLFNLHNLQKAWEGECGVEAWSDVYGSGF